MVNIRYSIHIPKWLYAMKEIRNGNNQNANRLSVKLDVTYSHLYQILADLQRRDFIRKEKSGRISVFVLTDAGHRVADGVCTILSELRVE